MRKFAVIVDVEQVPGLVETAREHGVEAITTDLFDAIDTTTISGVVVGLDFLSLRLVAACDGRDIPIVVLVPPKRSTQALEAFGIESGLPDTATWPQILDAVNLSIAQAPGDFNPQERGDRQERDEESTAHFIGVWGPAGAPGRSTIALNLAAEIALTGKRVLLIDADTYGGSIAGYLELFDEAPGFLSVARLAQQEAFDAAELARLSHLYRVGSSSFTVLSGMVNSRRWPELSPARIRAAFDALRPLFDVICIDLGFNLEQDEEIVSDLVGPRRNQATLEILRSVDSVVAVCGSEVVGVARFIHCLSDLREAAPEANLRIVANRVRSERTANAVAVRHTLSRFAGLDQVDVVAHDQTSFSRAIDMAAPLCLAAPKSGARSAIRDVALELAAQQVPVPMFSTVDN